MNMRSNPIELRTVGPERRLEFRYLAYNDRSYNYYDAATGKFGITPAGHSWTGWMQVPHVEAPEEQK
jgi:hypothetical protein